VVATHTNRKNLFKDAAEKLIEITERHYYQGEQSVLPLGIATKSAFLNSMTLDIAMGGSTNTVLHLLAIAHEAGVDFTMKDIDMLSRKVPNICKVAPSSHYHVEDVNNAGGIISILGELEKKGLLDTSVSRVDFPTLKEAINKYDVKRETVIPKAFDIYGSAAANNGRNLTFASQSTQVRLDVDREKGCIRSVENAYSKDGGLAVLYGNIAKNGCIVKTAGVDKSILIFTGNAKVFDSQDDSVNAILNGKIEKGDVVVIRYEGPKGGPGMQEMLYPTSYLKSTKIDKYCALITDGRFSGGTSGLSIGHVSPEAASGGEIALIRNGDKIEINIPERKINLLISENDLAKRREEELSK
jgi:dihydroxy-acid dehydratase